MTFYKTKKIVRWCVVQFFRLLWIIITFHSSLSVVSYVANPAYCVMYNS